MSHIPSYPDLPQLWLAAHHQPLAMSFGQTVNGARVTVTFPETSPLLVLAQSVDTQKRLVLAWIAQLLSKRGQSGLRLALLEQLGDRKLTGLLGNYSQTVFTISSQQGYTEALWCLEGTLLSREKAGVASPPWLVVLELSDEHALLPRARQAFQLLLERGTWAGLFLLVLARQGGTAALSLPDLFAATLVLDPGLQPSTSSPLQPALLCARLYCETNPTNAVTVLAPQIIPADVLTLLDQHTPRNLVARAAT